MSHVLTQGRGLLQNSMVGNYDGHLKIFVIDNGTNEGGGSS